MALADEINALVELGDSPIQPRKCAVFNAISQFEGDDKTSLIYLIDKTKVSSSRIAALLEKHGIQITYGRIKAHRARLAGLQNKCACPVEL